MSQNILELNQFLSMTADPPERSLTYPISRAVDDYIKAAGPSSHMKEMTPQEIEALAVFLNESADNLKGPFLVDAALVCDGCGRNLTFLDFVKTIVGTGPHSTTMIADILTGRRGAWVTIAGRSETRYVDCSCCGHIRAVKNHNYQSSVYSYYAF